MAETTPELVSPYIPVTVDDGLENPTDIAALLQRQENQIAALTDNLNSISQLDAISAKLDNIATAVNNAKASADAAKTAANNANTNASGAKSAVATLQSKVQAMNNNNIRNIGQKLNINSGYSGRYWDQANNCIFSSI